VTDQPLFAQVLAVVRGDQDEAVRVRGRPGLHQRVEVAVRLHDLARVEAVEEGEALGGNLQLAAREELHPGRPAREEAQPRPAAVGLCPRLGLYVLGADGPKAVGVVGRVGRQQVDEEELCAFVDALGGHPHNLLVGLVLLDPLETPHQAELLGEQVVGDHGVGP
jgi:hypothetical protein